MTAEVSRPPPLNSHGCLEAIPRVCTWDPTFTQAIQPGPGQNTTIGFYPIRLMGSLAGYLEERCYLQTTDYPFKR